MRICLLHWIASSIKARDHVLLVHLSIPSQPGPDVGAQYVFDKGRTTIPPSIFSVPLKGVTECSAYISNSPCSQPNLSLFLKMVPYPDPPISFSVLRSQSLFDYFPALTPTSNQLSNTIGSTFKYL